MSARIDERVCDPHVARDTRTVAGLTRIWCDAHHRGRVRRPIRTGAAQFGVYRGRVPVLCSECEEHLAYAEKRRAHCPKDPKPFCAHCDVHCYGASEREWQRTMMRYSGPRSIFRGYAVQAIRHALGACAVRKGRARQQGD